MNNSDKDWLQNRVAATIDDDSYLDRGEEQRIKEESTARGIPIREIDLLVKEELDRHGAVSERMLLDELDRLLHQYTDDDKKLDQKEERNTLQQVCVRAPGKKAALDPTVAAEYVTNFCRVQGASRSTDTKRWLVPVGSFAGVVALALVVFFAINKSGNNAVVAEVRPSQAVHESDRQAVRLSDSDRYDIDDQLRRAKLNIDKAQYTDPPENSAKASLDRIKDIDPTGQYRGAEVNQVASTIVEHYLKLAEKSGATGDRAGAEKWLARARLLNRDREVILEKERALGIGQAEK